MNLGVPGRSTMLRRIWRMLCAVLACALGMAALTPAAHAQTRAVINTTVSTDAVIVAPATLFKIEDLDFGLIAALPTAGTVVMNPDTANCTTTGGLIHAGACTPAEFVGMGVRRMIVRIQPPTNITVTAPGGATMLIDTITLDTSPDLTLQAPGNGNGNNRRYRIETTNGIFTFRLGGTLRVGANQAPGAYSGTFPVTIVYQ